MTEWMFVRGAGRICKESQTSGAVRVRDADVDGAFIDHDWEYGDRPDGWRVQSVAGGQVEPGAVLVALNDPVLDIAFGQRHVLMGTPVDDRVQASSAARQAHRDVTDLHPDRTLVGDVGVGCHPRPSAALAFGTGSFSRVLILPVADDGWNRGSRAWPR